VRLCELGGRICEGLRPALLAVPAGAVAAVAFMERAVQGSLASRVMLCVGGDAAGAAAGCLRGRVRQQRRQRPAAAHFWGTWRTQGRLVPLQTCQPYAPCVPRCGYGKAHSMKINEYSCNINHNKNYCKTDILNNTKVYFPGERWVLVEPLGLLSCIAPLSKTACFDLSSFPRISFQP